MDLSKNGQNFSLKGEKTQNAIGNTWSEYIIGSNTVSHPPLTINYVMVAKNPVGLRPIDVVFNEASVLDLKTDETTIGPFSDPNGISLSNHNAIEAKISILL